MEDTTNIPQVKKDDLKVGDNILIQVVANKPLQGRRILSESKHTVIENEKGLLVKKDSFDLYIKDIMVEIFLIHRAIGLVEFI